MEITLPNITPGPWNLLSARTLLHVETDASNPTGAGISICSIPKRADGTGVANATAIYALPDLMQALAELLQVVQVCAPSLKDGSVREEQINRAKLALQKAGAVIS